ncbi:MAG: hypothetical protein JWO95_621 [Verrucomicrobiales bacterium]|nr:hypothetical protein [Verrucomicrobiales bacterium]
MSLRKPNFRALVMIVCCVVGLHAHGQSFSKLSAHLINAYTVGSSNIVSGKPRLLKVLALDSGFPSGMLQAMRDYKVKVPNGKIIVRVYSPKMYSMTDDATTSANDFWNTIIQPALNSIGASDRTLIDYMEGPNEGQTPTIGYPFDQQVQASQWINQFWTNLTPKVVSAGMKPCIGSISVGNIDPFSLLSNFVPALRQAKAAGGAWSYHAYTVQYSTDVAAEIWWSLRYRQFYTYFAQNFPDLNDMPLILTEGGVDQSGDPLTSGWQARGTAAQYERWLNWFDYQMRQDPYLLGCTLFENGDPSGWPSFELEPITGWFRGYLLDPTSVPQVPSGLTANVANLLRLSWTNTPVNPTTYNIKRSTVSGGPYTVIARNVAEGVNAGTFTDTTALGGATYYYVVSALNNFGESDDSVEVSGSAAPPKINCSGGAVGAFTDDTFFNGGLTFTATNNINTNGIVNPAPMAVYQTQRYQSMTYTIPNLAPGSYKVRLHFAEVYFTSAGQRLFDVKINGAKVLSSFDMFAAAGAQFKANVQEFNAIPDPNGRITIDFITVLNNAACNGIEIVANATNAIPNPPTGLSTAVGSGNISLNWKAPSGATQFIVKRLNGGPYSVIATNVFASGYIDTSVAPGAYYYVVSAANGAGESANSAQVPAAATNALPDVVITAVSSIPAAFGPGTNVVFRATVKNQGGAATPPGVTLGIGFSIDSGGAVTWSSGYSESLGAGATIALNADGGPNGVNYWSATAGAHQVIANVDDINRFAEGNENNNILSVPFNVPVAAPVLLTPNIANANVILSWASYAGKTYRAQYKTNLNSSSWREIGLDFRGTGSSLSFTNLPTADQQRFYRVLQLD